MRFSDCAIQRLRDNGLVHLPRLLRLLPRRVVRRVRQEALYHPFPRCQGHRKCHHHPRGILHRKRKGMVPLQSRSDCTDRFVIQNCS